jgi:glycosyltransferase involved in cell wall biosynthesis
LGNPHGRLIGEVNDKEKQPFLAGAAALLFPIDWPEPFGLVMIEAMACGTPVIAHALCLVHCRLELLRTR